MKSVDNKDTSASRELVQAEKDVERDACQAENDAKQQARHEAELADLEALMTSLDTKHNGLLKNSLLKDPTSDEKTRGTLQTKRVTLVRARADGADCRLNMSEDGKVVGAGAFVYVGAGDPSIKCFGRT